MVKSTMHYAAAGGKLQSQPGQFARPEGLSNAEVNWEALAIKGQSVLRVFGGYVIMGFGCEGKGIGSSQDF